MKLEIFVRDTLVSIAKGVNDANQAFGPPYPFFLGVEPKRHVDFEVVLVVESKSTKEVGGKIKVWVAEIQGSGKGNSADKHAHTVKFSVNAAERQDFVKAKR
jgi:hypothetical protein